MRYRKIDMRRVRSVLLVLAGLMSFSFLRAQENGLAVSDEVMQQIYQEVKTPYKYGLVLVPPDRSKMFDCPVVFRKHDRWFMSYIVYDGRGYETWLAESEDLLNWREMGKILSFSDSGDWDFNQKAGYLGLQDPKWGGSYALEKYDGKYWLSYIGGGQRGYEAGVLSIGLAFTSKDPSSVHEWQRLKNPILTPADPDTRWWENSTLYKSTVLRDKAGHTGHRFVMYYNARGDSLNPARGAERIGMAVSDDMRHWKRFMKDPVINHHKGISGDAYLQKIGDVWVMFYFGAFWGGGPAAFNRFACSYDLIHWTDWKGDHLIAPSESYDDLFAHKSFVMKHEGVVYHFYCAVNKDEDRGIAVATSVDLGESKLLFNDDEKKK